MGYEYNCRALCACVHRCRIMCLPYSLGVLCHSVACDVPNIPKCAKALCIHHPLACANLLVLSTCVCHLHVVRT